MFRDSPEITDETGKSTLCIGICDLTEKTVESETNLALIILSSTFILCHKFPELIIQYVLQQDVLKNRQLNLNKTLFLNS